MKKNKSFIGFFNLPKGMTRKLFLKNMVCLSVLFAVALAAFCWHTASHSMWIRNYMSKGYELNTASLTSAVGTRQVVPDMRTAKEIGFQTGSFGIPSMVYKEYVYFQGDDYRFLIPVDAVEETGLYYDDDHNAYFGITDVAAWSAEIEAMEPVMYDAGNGIMAEYYLSPLERMVWITSGDLRFPAIVPYDQAINPGDSLTGFFTQFGEYMIADYAHDLYLKGGENEEVLSYFFDTRAVPVEFEDENWGYMVFYGIITGLVLLIVLMFFAFPHTHPFYRQMQRYGTYDEVTASIDEEFADGKKFIENRKTLLGDKWYIKKSTFMNIINRNPDQIPENQKEREGKGEGKVNKRRYTDYSQPKTSATEEKYDPLKENMKNRYNKYY